MGFSHQGPAPNFITEIFYLSNAFIHYGLVATIAAHDAAYKRYDELGRELERVQGDQSHQGVSSILTCHWKSPRELTLRSVE